MANVSMKNLMQEEILKANAPDFLQVLKLIFEISVCIHHVTTVLSPRSRLGRISEKKHVSAESQKRNLSAESWAIFS